MDISTFSTTKPKNKKSGQFQCNNCDRLYSEKSTIEKHLKLCEKGLLVKLTCKWCKLEFKSRGNLVRHALHMHGDNSYKSLQQPDFNHKCLVCKSAFRKRCQLTYHIRKTHFNLISRAPYCDQKQINQVWFEKVLNTNIIVEMSKIRPNMLMIKKVNSNGNIQVTETYREMVDLKRIYPIGHSQEKVICQICQKVYAKRDLKKHVEETHSKIAKHHCNNCLRVFKRSYTFLKHVCNKRRLRKLKRPVEIVNYDNQAEPL